MRLKLFLAAAAALFCSLSTLAQSKGSEVLYLKNGSVINCTVLETRPGESVKIKNSYGDIMVYKMEEVDKVVKNTSRDDDDDDDDRYEVGCPARGYRGFVDAGMSVGKVEETDDYYGEAEKVSYNRVSVLTTHGFQFNSNIFAGLGFGYQIAVGADCDSDLEVLMPIYGAFRYDLFAKKITPFAEARLGAFTNIGQEYIDYTGFFGNINFGVRLSRFNVSIGYEVLAGTACVDGYYGSDTSDATCSSFNFRVGFDFGKRK